MKAVVPIPASQSTRPADEEQVWMSRAQRPENAARYYQATKANFCSSRLDICFYSDTRKTVQTGFKQMVNRLLSVLSQ
jgi:hypothetical protein